MTIQEFTNKYSDYFWYADGEIGSWGFDESFQDCDALDDIEEIKTDLVSGFVEKLTQLMECSHYDCIEAIEGNIRLLESAKEELEILQNI